jgi:hypothetical protein
MAYDLLKKIEERSFPDSNVEKFNEFLGSFLSEFVLIQFL